MENLRKIREKRNLNQLKVATDNEITQESISKYENDIAFPSKDILIRLADYFNCSVDYLLDRTDNSQINRNNVNKEDEYIENLIFRIKRLSGDNKNKLEGYLKALEDEK